MAGPSRIEFALLIGALGLAACSKGESKQADATTPANASSAAASGTLAPMDTAKPTNLAGTRWKLVEIQSMSDQQGTTRPADPSKYTIVFDAEGGLLSMQLDCNRAKGTYQDDPSKDKRSGTLTINGLAGTRVACPSPSLGDRVARDMGHVRSYRFDNGRLAMSLMADGGIYVWEKDASDAHMSQARPSFSCTNATQQVEQLICNDAELAALDAKMADAYAAAMEKPSSPEARHTLKNEHQAWTTRRNDCAKATDKRECTKREIVGRTAALGAK